MNDAKTYYISDLAKELGISQRSIRYYEEMGFISPLRTVGGFRSYSLHDVDVLKMVIRFKDLGLALEEIRALILPDKDALTSESVKHLREALLSRRKDFELKIKKYKESIEQIDHVLKILSNCGNCGKPSKVGECEECLEKHGEDISPLIHMRHSE